MPVPGPFQAAATRSPSVKRSPSSPWAPSLQPEKQALLQLGPRNASPFFSRHRPSDPLPPVWCISSLTCCFHSSPDQARLYQVSIKLREKMLLQIPEAKPPREGSPQAPVPCLLTPGSRWSLHLVLMENASRGRGCSPQWFLLTVQLAPLTRGFCPDLHYRIRSRERPDCCLQSEYPHLPESRSGTQGASSSVAP